MSFLIEGKPWWQSKTVWSGFVAVAAGVAGVFGYTVTDGDQAQLVGTLTGFAGMVGGLGAMIGRVVATKGLTKK